MAVRLLVIFAVLATIGGGVAIARLSLSPPPASETPAPATAPPTTPAPTATPSPTPSSTSTPIPTETPAPTTTATPTPAPTPTTATPDSADERLSRRITRLVQDADINGKVSVVVLDDGGAQRYGLRPRAALLPASTQKLVVAAAALARLGPNYRYPTTVTATARPNARGVIAGDLVIVGSGDPALGSPDFGAIEPDRPRTKLEDLARQIAGSGVRRIRGDIYGDPRVFADQPVPEGWPQRYFDSFDATRVSGLTVNAGRRFDRSGGSLQASVAADPALEAARELHHLLRQHGIRIDGVLSSRTPPAASVQLGQVRSPDLATILRYTVNESDNHMADGLFRTVGAAGGDPTWAGAATATMNTLAPLGLDWTGIVLADGSGLSRANRMTVTLLAQLQERMWRSTLASYWRPLLAVAGRSGTLDGRLLGTVAEGRLFGKTGSLRDVRSLVGTVEGPGGKDLHMAVIGNELDWDSSQQTRELIDGVARLSAEQLYGCRWVKPPPKRGGDKRDRQPRPARLVCAGAPA